MKLIPMTDFVLEQEKEWKPVFGFEGYYEVSDIGRCRSIERDIIYNNDEKTRKGIWKGKILKPTLKEDGYLRYNLSKEGKITRILAHRMVALAFLQNPENKRVVNHKDSIRHNNVLNNLEWDTDSENVLHSYKKGNRKEKFYGHCCIKKDIKLDILISLKTFVLNLEPTRKQIENYANFLDMKLELGHFVPTDEDGNVWKYPPTQEEWEWAQNDSMEAEQSFKQKEYYYQKAKEKVLFEDFTVLSNEEGVIELVCNDIFINYNKEEDLFFLDSWNNDYVIMNIESLSNFITNTVSTITLTENAIKQWN